MITKSKKGYVHNSIVMSAMNAKQIEKIRKYNEIIDAVKNEYAELLINSQHFAKKSKERVDVRRDIGSMAIILEKLCLIEKCIYKVYYPNVDLPEYIEIQNKLIKQDAVLAEPASANNLRLVQKMLDANKEEIVEKQKETTDLGEENDVVTLLHYVLHDKITKNNSDYTHKIFSRYCTFANLDDKEKIFAHKDIERLLDGYVKTRKQYETHKTKMCEKYNNFGGYWMYAMEKDLSEPINHKTSLLSVLPRRRGTISPLYLMEEKSSDKQNTK